MSFSFRLDDVDRATDLRPTRPLAEQLGEALAIGGDPALAVIEHTSTHPLLAAVHVAFAEHRPLVLSPDAVWLTLAQGVAQHVRQHAEVLRPRLVRHAGTRALRIDLDGPLPADAAGWAAIVSGFRDRLADELGDGRARLFECDFSTSTDVERVAGRIALMDVYSPYFDYYVYCVCGIPEVTLLGTADDWRRIRARIDVLAELDLEFWTRSLAPIADELVRAAEGAPDLEFWRRIYKPRDAYGGELITGWIARLYPYLVTEGRDTYQNPLLALPIDEPRDVTPDDDEDPWYAGPGIRSDVVPVGPCSARIEVVNTISGERRSLELHGGVIAVAQDPQGRLAPTCGWLLRPTSASITIVVERIRAEHTWSPAQPRRFGFSGPADLVGLYHAFEEATLFAATRPWRLLPPAEHQRIGFALDSGWTTDVERFLDLPDGTFLALASHDASTLVVRCHVDDLEPIPPPELDDEGTLRDDRRMSRRPVAEVPVIAGTIAEILAQALDSGGATDFRSSQSLLAVLPDYLLKPRPVRRVKPRKK